jgi:rubrerythrin
MMSTSIENLREAFAGESQANRRYLAFAQKAEKEGFTQIAKLFRAAADAETIHALSHLKITGEIKSTNENLETAISGETFEFSKMYPEYIKTAKEEGNKRATWSFEVANKVEEVHANLYMKALQAVNGNNDLLETDYYVCNVCGNTVENEAPDRCPICNAPKRQFFKVS